MYKILSLSSKTRSANKKILQMSRKIISTISNPLRRNQHRRQQISSTPINHCWSHSSKNSQLPRIYHCLCQLEHNQSHNKNLQSIVRSCCVLASFPGGLLESV